MTDENYEKKALKVVNKLSHVDCFQALEGKETLLFS